MEFLLSTLWESENEKSNYLVTNHQENPKSLEKTPKISTKQKSLLHLVKVHYKWQLNKETQVAADIAPRVE